MTGDLDPEIRVVVLDTTGPVETLAIERWPRAKALAQHGLKPGVDRALVRGRKQVKRGERQGVKEKPRDLPGPGLPIADFEPAAS